MPSKIMRCECKHDFQDQKYGKWQRVHNWAEKKNSWRCSTCGKEKVGKPKEEVTEE